jgi:hypothetical protein
MFDGHFGVVLDGHITILRNNIRVLTQQAGGGGKGSFVVWIAQQRSKLDPLLAQRCGDSEAPLHRAIETMPWIYWRSQKAPPIFVT